MCEVDSTDSTLTSCTGCMNGYIDPTDSNRCVSKCPSGYYGTSEYSYRGMIASTYCEQCSSDCEECFDSSYCTVCTDGKFLEKLNYTVSYGNCLDKDSNDYSTTLYVTNNDITDDVQTVDGTSGKPFGDLEDAITRAYELASQYSSTDITIILKADSGDSHYLLRSARDFYIPIYTAKDDQSLKLTIESEDSSSPVTIVNKRRDIFNLKVGAGLTLSNIIFDNLDSIIPYDYTGDDTGVSWP